MRRRQFLILSAASVGGVIVFSLDRKAFRLAAQDKPAQSIKIPLKFVTQQEALIVAAAASRIFPTDDTGPGAALPVHARAGRHDHRAVSRPRRRELLPPALAAFESLHPGRFPIPEPGLYEPHPDPHGVRPSDRRCAGGPLPEKARPSGLAAYPGSNQPGSKHRVLA
jgi:hypothetical protein